MQCNIDAKGKAVRLTLGLVLACMGIIAIILQQTGVIADRVWLYVGFSLLAFGGFGIFEGWKGWCAMRAMGFRTRV